MSLHARHFATGEPVALAVAGGRITSIAPSDQQPAAWVAPSFFDPQINGCGGIGFNAPTLTVDGVRFVATECGRHGIGGFCPTLITAGFDALRHGFTTLAAAREADPELARSIPGYHLEGPYLSGEDGPRGAHPREHARDPDWDEFRRLQDAAAGLILMVTVAPERSGAIRFIEQLTTSGVVVAIGHTAATTEQLRDAVDAGARTSTHLGNGAHAVLPRHPNYIWDQLADDRLWMSIISDGHHLPPAVVKSLVRAKGTGRTLITCDASSLAGLPAGRYREWGNDLEVLPTGKIIVAGTPYLAGSGHFTDVCVGNLVRDAGVTLAEAVEMASVRPRELLGLPVPRFEVGAPADWVVFDWEQGREIRVRHIL
ncbi:MAG TPA: amidohydrolase family protein [Urbifossiella sp.]|jgi:N-acetylglucosamine-6-phosphate deacetylase|nr:amidohydrolase family protein [Urbifossiella sp.]